MNKIPEGYFSLYVLKEPEETRKGAIILSQVDNVVEELPWIKNRFYIVERRGWRGLNESKHAHIKLVEDLSLWDETISCFPEAICLDIGPADFVDIDEFKPLNINKDYDGIQISHWSNFKRPELFTRAAGLLHSRKFLKLGHFVDGGTPVELEIRNKNVLLAKELGANIDMPNNYAVDNNYFPSDKTIINEYINQARIGILTTAVEGINRFKMECLSAGVPVIVPIDTSHPTKKHINDETGGFFEPNPECLAKKIEEVLSHSELYFPRAYIERTTGKLISIQKLKKALEELCEQDNQEFIFDNISWDGRNQSLTWGKNVFAKLMRYK